MFIQKYYEELIWFVLIPLLIVLIVFGLFLFFSRKKENKDILEYNYKANFFSSLIAVFFGAILFSVSLGFSITFINAVYLNKLESVYPFMIILLYIFPVIPFAFLIYFVVHFIKVIKSQEKENDVYLKVEILDGE